MNIYQAVNQAILDRINALPRAAPDTPKRQRRYRPIRTERYDLSRGQIRLQQEWAKLTAPA